MVDFTRNTTVIDVEAVDSEDGDAPSTSSGSRGVQRCQLCFLHRPMAQLRRLPLRRDKYEPILWNAGAPYEIVSDLIRRLEARIGIRVCRLHFPIEENKVKGERVYPTTCKLCGEKRLPMDLRNVPTCPERRRLFYEYANVSTEKISEVETHLIEKPRVNFLVCVAHLPFPRRKVKEHLKSTLIFAEDGTVRRLTPGPAYTPESSRRTKLVPGSGKVRCHWCSELRNPKYLRKFPDYEPAQDQFFERNGATSDRVYELKNMNKGKLRGLRMCYEHFPKEWAHARGRFWYRLHFGSEKEKQAAQKRRDKRILNTAQKRCSASEDSGLLCTSKMFQDPIADEREDRKEEEEEIDVEGVYVPEYQRTPLPSVLSLSDKGTVQAAQTLCQLGQPDRLLLPPVSLPSSSRTNTAGTFGMSMPPPSAYGPPMTPFTGPSATGSTLPHAAFPSTFPFFANPPQSTIRFPLPVHQPDASGFHFSSQ